MNNYLQPISRAFIALLFIFTGFTKITGFEGVSAMMGGAGIPAPGLFLVGAILIELIGGLMLLVGYKVRLASVALLIFMVPTTIIFHAANINATPAGQMEIIGTLKNLAIMGGLLIMAVSGAGAYSVDAMKLRESGTLRTV